LDEKEKNISLTKTEVDVLQGTSIEVITYSVFYLLVFPGTFKSVRVWHQFYS